jgi:hypothetical protein
VRLDGNDIRIATLEKFRNYSSGSGGGYQDQQLAVINIRLSIPPLSFLGQL